MATSFSSGRNRSTRREPPTIGQQLVIYITCGCESSAPFCNLQNQEGTHAVLVIGLYELLGNQLPNSLSHPGPASISMLFKSCWCTGADLGFVVRGSVSRRGIWGPLKVPSGSVRGPVRRSPREALGFCGITDIYLNDNFEPTTPFLSDQKNLTLSLNFVW